MVKTVALSVVPAWLIAAVAAIAVALTPLREDWPLWIPVACGVCVILALALQVATRRPEGLVERAGAAVGGVVALFAVATLVLWLVEVV